jgi:hypothetical protein
MERHDFYMTMVSMDFAKDDTIELIATVRENHSGEILQNTIVPAIGAHPTPEFHAVVLAKVSNPVYNETVNLRIPPMGIENAHLYFVIRDSMKFLGKF